MSALNFDLCLIFPQKKLIDAVKISQNDIYSFCLIEKNDLEFNCSPESAPTAIHLILCVQKMNGLLLLTH